MREVNLSWTTFKSTVSSKGLAMQYIDTGDNYDIWAVEGSDTYRAVIIQTSPAGTDQSDFENNYKDDANKPLFIGEDRVFNDEEIRDTSNHTSAVSDNRGAIPKTLLIDNELDQTVTVQLQGARDSAFTNVINIGDSFDVTTSTHDYATISDYFPYMRVSVSCSTAPTSGNLNIYLLRVRT